jgi:hypothetical protein
VSFQYLSDLLSLPLQVSRLLAASALLFVGACLAPSEVCALQPGHLQTALENLGHQSVLADHRRFEQRFPRGSRVYYYDQFLIEDGANSTVLSARSNFYRDASGLKATDLIANKSRRFSWRAQISRQNDSGVLVIGPQDTLEPFLQQLRQVGSAHLERIVETGPDFRIPTSTYNMSRLWPRTCVGRWWGRSLPVWNHNFVYRLVYG